MTMRTKIDNGMHLNIGRVGSGTIDGNLRAGAPTSLVGALA